MTATKVSSHTEGAKIPGLTIDRLPFPSDHKRLRICWHVIFCCPGLKERKKAEFSTEHLNPGKILVTYRAKAKLEKHCTNLRAMRVPNTLAAISSLSLSFPFLQVFLRRVSLELLEFRPSIFENLYGNVEPIDLGRADISGVVGRG